jgi:hypothetical protein
LTTPTTSLSITSGKQNIEPIERPALATNFLDHFFNDFGILFIEIRIQNHLTQIVQQTSHKKNSESSATSKIFDVANAQSNIHETLSDDNPQIKQKAGRSQPR